MAGTSVAVIQEVGFDSLSNEKLLGGSGSCLQRAQDGSECCVQRGLARGERARNHWEKEAFPIPAPPPLQVKNTGSASGMCWSPDKVQRKLKTNFKTPT